MVVAARPALAKRLALGLLCALMTTAFASGLALQGKHYFYCATMGVIVDDPCVDSAPVDRDVALHEAKVDCCRVGRMPNLPASALAAPLDVPAAAFVAVLPPPAVVAPPPAREARILERSTGPPLRDVRVHALTMVFLT